MRAGRAAGAGAAIVRAVALGVCVALMTAGCAGARRHTGEHAEPPPVGMSRGTVVVGGRERTFQVYRPASLPAVAPLVVMLHGGFGDGAQAERSYGWDAEADREHFLVAYPDGADHAWNVGGGCCGRPAATGSDDVAFITRVVAYLRGRIRLDPDRLYATGISNGGMMAYRLACDSRLFAAVGPDSATLLGPCPSPAPVSLIHIHGTADRSVRYEGGPGDGVARVDGPAVPVVVAGWRRTDQCGVPAVTGRPPVTTSSAGCPQGRAVELISIAGAGHQWPGAPPRPVIQRLLRADPPSQALDATTVIWRFFAAHPMPH